MQAAAELTAEIEGRRGEAGDANKYEVLFKRDQEMTEFIDRFPDMRDKEVSGQRGLRMRTKGGAVLSGRARRPAAQYLQALTAPLFPACLALDLPASPHM
jgi:hypothetical protein